MPNTEKEARLQRLFARRENLFRRAQLCLDASKLLESDPENLNNLKNFEIRYSTLEKTVIDYREIVNNIVVLKQELEPDEPPSYDILEAFEDINDMIQYLANKYIKNPKCNIASNSEQPIKPQIFMPKIELMKFNGDDMSIWPLFFENFKQLVHLKSEFSNAEKLQYLLSSLTGRALKTCSSIEPLPDNYDTIFQLLKDTYHDKKYLANMYLDRLINFRSLPNNNPNSLQIFLEKYDTNARALQRLNIENLDDYILTYLAMSKLPTETVNCFELVRDNSNLPQYDEIVNFVRRQSKILTKSEKPRNHPNNSNAQSNFKNSKSFITNNFNSNSNDNPCIFGCRSNHLLKNCNSFKSSNFETKYKFIKDKNLCLNCFSSNHKVSVCPSKFTCLKCRSKHHTYLHKDIEPKNPSSNVDCSPSTSQSISNKSNEECTQTLCSQIVQSNIKNVVLLSTAFVKTYDRWGKEHHLRFLVDNASMSNLLTFETCKKLGLSYSKLTSNVHGIGGTVKPLKGRASLNIFSNINPHLKYSIEVLLIDQITNLLPDVPIDTSSLDYLKYLPLADPTFHIPGKIDGILGAQIFAEILGPHRVAGEKNKPTAVQTALGYLVIGPSRPLENNINRSYCTFVTLESLLENMFEIEKFADDPIKSKDDQICEDLFMSTVQRDSTGRYLVSLPFKDSPSKLGRSYDLAKKRLLSLEHRLDTTPLLRQTYSEVIQDYINQGHMSLVKENKLNVPSFYAAHHCVWKPNSCSTPCRIVFDFSMKSDNGISLNDILYKGPKLHNNIFTILINFRLFPICLGADIKGMYRQINMIKEHRPYQRILWRFNTDDPIQVYELNTVTFGVSSSPFLSLRTVKQLIQDEAHNFPDILEYIERDIFMDDLICSVSNVEVAKTTHSQIVEFFHAGGFPIVKWISNSLDVLSTIPIKIQSPSIWEFDKSYLKVLGLQYNPSTDQFSFKIENEITGLCTKRAMLSVVSRIFDPLGFVSPVTLFIKILIKRLWESKLHWDDPAPSNIEKVWLKFKVEFRHLNKIIIPRHILVFENVSLSLIGFCDSSVAGYASVIYVRTVDLSGQVNVTLLCSQARVTPMSKITLPRLELCAATQLAKLMSHVRDTYLKRKSIDSIYAVSDSMITLNWIHSTPNKWKTFISNRVSKIQNSLPPAHWVFVPGKENPSDCASRGLLPSALVDHPTWFSGPNWLKLPPSGWPITYFQDNVNSEQINKEIRVLVTIKEEITLPLYHLIEYFSSWSSLLRSTVYVLRFAKLLPNKNYITKSDLHKAEIYLIRTVQRRHFQDEFKLLGQNKSLKSYLRRLNPFIEDGIIRVGGRLSKASIPYSHKHPMLLPKSDPLISLIINYYHKLYCHTGAYLLQSILSRQYWILSARNTIRKCIWRCNTCFRLNPKPSYPLMADLPTERVNEAKAFESTGIDYTGSFQITLGRRRGTKSQKAYICLFVCMATRAIHLELAADLSTDSFLSAFKRFLSRRGHCRTIFSDNGTNFIGAKRKLDEIYNLTQSVEFKNAFRDELNVQKIDWKFNPPSAPHFGGSFESQIKRVKSHLSRVIGQQILTYEEFYTVLCQIEAVLNSRPLTILSSDPNDLRPLTPAHFLYSAPLGSLPAEDVTSIPQNRLDRYKMLDNMVQHFWKRWHMEYLSTLQIRQKWNTTVNPPKIGSVVVLILDNLPPLHWPLAIIEELMPGSDGIVRVAKVKMKSGTLVRPLVKLCPLPTQ